MCFQVNVGGLDVNIHGRTPTKPKPQLCCPRCPNKYVSRAELDAHTTNDHGESHDCHICQARFASAQALFSHQYLHTTRDGPCMCGVCGEGFLYESQRKKHMIKHDPNAKIYECPYKCGKGPWVNKADQTRHAKKHTRELEGDPLKCKEILANGKQCEYTTFNEKLFKEHQVHKHEKDPRYFCACGYKTRWYRLMRKHLDEPPTSDCKLILAPRGFELESNEEGDGDDGLPPNNPGGNLGGGPGPAPGGGAAAVAV